MPIIELELSGKASKSNAPLYLILMVCFVFCPIQVMARELILVHIYA